MPVSFLYLEKLQCVSTPWGAENEPPMEKNPFMAVFPCEGHALNYGNDTGGRPEWLQKHAWLQKAYFSLYSEILYLSKPIAYQWHVRRLLKIQTSFSIQLCMELAHLLEQHLTFPQGKTLWTLTSTLAMQNCAQTPRPKADGNSLMPWDLVHSPRRYPGQLAPGGPAWAGGLDQVTSRDPCWPQLLCDCMALWCAVNQWCKTPLRLPASSPALKGLHVGRSVGNLWRFVWDPLWKHRHRQGHWRFLVPHPSGKAGCCQSLLPHFALDYWLLWWNSSHMLLFSRKHHQYSENELFWFGGSVQLQKTRSKCHAWDNWFPRKTSHLDHKPLVHFTVGHTAVILLWWQRFCIFEAYHTCTR